MLQVEVKLPNAVPDKMPRDGFRCSGPDLGQGRSRSPPAHRHVGEPHPKDHPEMSTVGNDPRRL